MTPEVAILIPHFQTPDLSLLCLRLLRQRTRLQGVETVVVDNGSTDGSGDLLRSLRWVRVLRRDPLPDERPTLSHGRALNFALHATTAPLVLVLHTDTMVIRSEWLDYLKNELEIGGPRCAGVGSWKMESRPLWRRAAKWLETSCRNLYSPREPAKPYLRSHCAFYRREALATRPEAFEPSEGRCAGEELHQSFEADGWTTRFLSPESLGRYVHHLNHATLALNETVGQGKRYVPRTRVRAMRRIDAFFRGIDAPRVLADDSLDAVLN